MISTLSFTILVDNRPGSPQLETEHGFSVWIEADGRRILFDVGQTAAALRNAAKLGIDITTAGTLVVSHGHFDHTGCVSQVLAANGKCRVVGHAGITIPRYSRQPDGSMKTIGISNATRRALALHENRILLEDEPYMIAPDIGITGAIPRLNGFEDTGGTFFLDIQGNAADPVADDMAMWFSTAHGTVVLTGCGHSGIVNTLEYIRSKTGAAVTFVTGGFHLLHATRQRLDETCRYLSAVVSGKIIPCHCTGDEAVACMQERLPATVEYGYTGMRIAP